MKLLNQILECDTEDQAKWLAFLDCMGEDMRDVPKLAGLSRDEMRMKLINLIDNRCFEIWTCSKGHVHYSSTAKGESLLKD